MKLGKIHICLNCGTKYICEDLDCKLPVKFGNCCDKCKWESLSKRQRGNK